MIVLRVPLLSMVFQWFWYHWTITIECFLTDWPLTSMVFQWFSTNSGTMVNDGFGPFKRPKQARNCHISHFLTNALHDKERRLMNPPNHCRVPRTFCRLKIKSKLFGLWGQHFAAIAKFQWFSKSPSPLNGMVWGNHWVQWFWGQATIGFDGCRWLSTIGPTMEWLHTIVEV